MDKQFKEFTYGAWRFFAREPEMISSWIGSYQTLMHESPVKSNRNRTVFAFEAGGRRFYAKLSNPEGKAQQILSRIKSKAAKEAEAFILLESLSIPCARLEAWGSSGHLSMIVTEEVAGAVPARNYWFETASKGKEREAFLSALSGLLRLLISRGISHPDLHAGNILIVPAEMRLVLVDCVGIVRKRNYNDNHVFNTLRTLGFMRGELDEKEGTALVLSLLGDASNISKALETWMKIIEFEERDTLKSWPKRRRQIEADDPRFVIRSGDYFIRCSISGLPMMRGEDISNLEQCGLSSVKMPSAEAEERWLASFMNEFLRRKPDPGEAIAIGMEEAGMRIVIVRQKHN